MKPCPPPTQLYLCPFPSFDLKLCDCYVPVHPTSLWVSWRFTNSMCQIWLLGWLEVFPKAHWQAMSVVLYLCLRREGLIHTVSLIHVINFRLIMQNSKLASWSNIARRWKWCYSHLQLAKGVGDTVIETWEAGMCHSCLHSFTVYGIQCTCNHYTEE